MGADYCKICCLIVAPYDKELKRLNGFVAHRRCLKKAVPQFCSDVEKTISGLKQFNYSGFSLWLQKVRNVKEAEKLVITLRKELFKFSLRFRKHKKIEKAAKELRRLAETHLLLEIP